MIQVTPAIAIDGNEIEFSFVRSSGPGGQNVNKVSSATVLRYDVVRSTLPETVSQRLTRLAGKRMTQDGVLIIKAQSFRTQERNREDALQRLIELIQQAATFPKARIPTKPTRASQKQRIESKRYHGEVKRLRKEVPGTE